MIKYQIVSPRHYLAIFGDNQWHEFSVTLFVVGCTSDSLLKILLYATIEIIKEVHVCNYIYHNLYEAKSITFN